MADIYRSVDGNGNVTYGDTPPAGAGKLDVLTASGRRDIRGDSKPSLSHAQINDLIKAVQQVTPHLQDYLNFLAFARRTDPRGFERVMLKLKQQDPLLFEKLRKMPELRSFGQSAFGASAVERNLSFAAGAVGGSYVGSAEKWLATTVKEYMKEKRWGGYADDVLGSKASTLPAPPAPTYSNTRLGQFLKVDDVSAAQASKAAAKDMEWGRAAVRGAAATALTRVAKPGLDLMIGALDVDFFKGISAIQGMRLGKDLVDRGILTPEEALELRGMMARAEFDQARALIEAGAQRARAGQ